MYTSCTLYVYDMRECGSTLYMTRDGFKTRPLYLMCVYVHFLLSFINILYGAAALP